MLEAVLALSPLGVIALLAYIIYLLVWGKGNLPGLSADTTTIATNHLHELPEMAETLRRLETQLGKMNDHLIWIKARLNGRDHS